MDNKVPQTVVETPEFIRQASSCMDEESRNRFVNYIASNPLAGELIQGTGGARKIRWSSNAHRGKRGGARIIYYYHNQNMPIFLFTAYSKNQKTNLSMEERNGLKRIIVQLVEAYER
jgi:mRNA-degrading endonuclease RelE of RelBE toxin-antitoxin system